MWPVDGLADNLVTIRKAAAEANPAQRDTIRRASRDVERSYLNAVAPWHGRSEAGENDALIGKAQKLRKRDENLSEYEALRQAARRTAA